jgi:ribosome-associated translation inhibitor RaiA
MEDSKFNINESSPEVKSFIYQQIQDLKSFMTPKSVISVVSKQISGDDDKRAKSKKRKNTFYEVAISISENTVTLEEIARNPNIFEAIRIAKSKLYNTLLKIQDEVISREDREAQLISIKKSIIH